MRPLADSESRVVSLLVRLAALERSRQPAGVPFLCWTLTDEDIDTAAREHDVDVAEYRRRLTAIHDASERARQSFRVPRDLWYEGPLGTALIAYLMKDQDGAFSVEDAEVICAAVCAAVGPARWPEGYPYR